MLVKNVPGVPKEAREAKWKFFEDEKPIRISGVKERESLPGVLS